jgi:oxygen-independent coproporphyrinogen-3 oxidase
MRIIDLEGSREELEALLAHSARADYVYSYPPRQCYRPLPEKLLTQAVRDSLVRQHPLNLYFHFPFCAQICAFCNLFAVAGSRAEEHEEYLRLLHQELDYYAPLIEGRPVDTVYLGGGTPSLLDPRLFERLFERLRVLGLCDVAEVPEVALEVSPDTATPERLSQLRKTGINRINLGVQSWQNEELQLIGRKYDNQTPLAAVDAALATDFDNVCVDLIYGLQAQTDASWEKSVDEVVARRPHTVCAYPLTLRPKTGFAARGYVDLEDTRQYKRYDYVHTALLDAGYKQETHVRWVLPGGGYRQKANHWAGQDILGVGAGARGYLWHTDYRNGYSVRSRRGALRSWAERVCANTHGRSEGYLMTEDERRRKTVILSLNNLDRQAFRSVHGVDVEDVFGDILSVLREIGMLTDDGQSLRLTAAGTRVRDVIVQAFFSPEVRSLIKQFNYDE